MNIISRVVLTSSFLLGMPVFGAGFDPSTVPACETGSLASYISSYGNSLSSGCSVGNLAFNLFAFQEVKTTSGGTLTGLLTASDFYIEPVFALNSFNIKPYDASKINGTFPAMRYVFAWQVDPAPIIEGDRFTLDPPVGPVFGTKFGCLDSTFTFGNIQDQLINAGGPSGYSETTFQCQGPNSNPYVLKADGLESTAQGLSDSIQFTDAAFKLDVRLVLDYEAGTVRGFDGIETAIATSVPEPAANAMIAGGLALMGWYGRRRLKK